MSSPVAIVLILQLVPNQSQPLELPIDKLFNVNRPSRMFWHWSYIFWPGKIARLLFELYNSELKNICITSSGLTNVSQFSGKQIVFNEYLSICVLGFFFGCLFCFRFFLSMTFFHTDTNTFICVCKFCVECKYGNMSISKVVKFYWTFQCQYHAHSVTNAKCALLQVWHAVSPVYNFFQVQWILVTCSLSSNKLAIHYKTTL